MVQRDKPADLGPGPTQAGRAQALMETDLPMPRIDLVAGRIRAGPEGAQMARIGPAGMRMVGTVQGREPTTVARAVEQMQIVRALEITGQAAARTQTIEERVRRTIISRRDQRRWH